MKISAVELKVGYLIEHQGMLWRVAKLQHVKPGKGGAFMQAEMKAIESGRKLNERFRSEDTVERVILDERPMQYLYQETNSYIFMDLESYEQTPLPEDVLEEQKYYLLPNTEVRISFYEGRPIAINLPPTVVLEVIDTEPNVKGATATTAFKPAKTETGLVLQVPPFVETGEKIKVNTDTGEYIERA
jgi:elongation factor P